MAINQKDIVKFFKLGILNPIRYNGGDTLGENIDQEILGAEAVFLNHATGGIPTAIRWAGNLRPVATSCLRNPPYQGFQADINLSNGLLTTCKL